MNPLDIDATIVGAVVELRYASHGEAVAQLRLLRDLLAQRDDLLAALAEIGKGEGPYNTDRLKHASNTIEAMQDIAFAAIAAATGAQS